MRHVKTNEEYKFFKGKKIDDTSWSNPRSNKKDPNEPFFNVNKIEYKKERDQKEICKILNMPYVAYKNFCEKLKNHYWGANRGLWNEGGSASVATGASDEDSSYYWMNLTDSDETDDRVFFFPNKDFVTVTLKGKKKLFKNIYDESDGVTARDSMPDLESIAEYLITSRKIEIEKFSNLRKKGKSDKYEYLTTED